MSPNDKSPAATVNDLTSTTLGTLVTALCIEDWRIILMVHNNIDKLVRPDMWQWIYDSNIDISAERRVLNRDLECIYLISEEKYPIIEFAPFAPKR